jgi:hypothetical protein
MQLMLCSKRAPFAGSRGKEEIAAHGGLKQRCPIGSLARNYELDICRMKVKCKHSIDGIKVSMSN